MGLLLHKVVQSWVEVGNMFSISFCVFDVEEMNALDNGTLVFLCFMLHEKFLGLLLKSSM